MNKRLVVLLGVLAVSVGSAQADWIKHEGHGATAKGASSVTRINFNQVKHRDLDGFVTACKASCDENSDTCGGFNLNYNNTDKTRPAYCVFSEEDYTLVDMPTKDFYQVVSHDEVLALLEQLVPNLNTQEDAKWLTEVVKDAEFMVCGKATESNCDGKLKRIGPRVGIAPNTGRCARGGKNIKIAVVDDEALFVEGLSLLFSNVEHIKVTTTANNGLEFLGFLEGNLETDFPDIALVDIQMKPMDGFQLVEALKDKYPDLKIIILASHYKSNVLGNMIKPGVSAFIPKNANKELLVTAIESVHSCGVFFSVVNISYR